MRFLSTTALSIALAAVSVGLVVPSAAMAQKKEKDKKEEGGAPKLALSKDFMPAAQELQKLSGASDWAGVKAKLAEVEPKATKPDDKYFYGQIMLNAGLQLKEQATQRKGLETMLASGLTPAADVPKFQFFVGQFAFVEKDWPAARQNLDAAIKAGYPDPQALVLLANSYFIDAQSHVQGNAFAPAGKELIKQGLPYLEQAITKQEAAGQEPDKSWYNTGFRMSIASADPSQPQWTERALAHSGTAENWRLALRGFQDANTGLTRDENIDLLRLMSASKSLQNAYSYNEYAEAAWRLGLPGEVKTVIDSGRTTGEIDKAALGDLYQLASGNISKDQASLPASEKSATAAATGKPAANTAHAYLGYGNYAKAIELYKLALQKGGVDANEVNTRLGIALARSGDKAGAIEAFNKVQGAGARKTIASLWTVWVNHPTA